MVKKFIFLAVLFSLACSVQSQTLEVGVGGGVTYYIGDLNPAVPFLDIQPAYGLSVRYSNSTRWAYKATVNSGNISSKARFPRNIAVEGAGFNKPFQELTLTAEFNFFDYFTGSERSYVSPFLFGGIGVARVPITIFAVDAIFQLIDPVTTNRIEPVVVFGAGVKYSLTKRLGLSAEWGMRRMFTDRLDHHPDIRFNDFEPWDDAGTTDWYSFAGITLTYLFRLEKKHKCNTFDNQNYR